MFIEDFEKDVKEIIGVITVCARPKELMLIVKSTNGKISIANEWNVWEINHNLFFGRPVGKQLIKKYETA
jgi:hypothetical protein